MPTHYEFDHDARSVFALLTDPEFLVDRCLEMGELEASCEVEERGKSTIISLTRKVEQDLPKFLAKMIHPVQTMQLTETWQSDGEGGFNGDYTFVMQGQPVTISATFELYPTDGGCCYVIDHSVEAKVPLVGGRIEKYIHAKAQEGCITEMEYAQQRLA